ncbi:ABC transporter substrate-binding protein [Pseudoalteromonas mariniglutinosa]|uniref:ABC transporter substrate-binding protein n=1 Tax=Pseudoalteromonas mariniglutinosa TaxID=206042 RepID=UPI00384DE585
MFKALLFICCCGLLCLNTVAAKSPKVIFINPGHANNNITGPFWHEVSALMADAAADFNIELNTYYANRNHILMKSLIIDAIAVNPDMLILVDEKGILTSLLTSLPAFDTPIYFLLNRPTDKNLQALLKQGVNIQGSVVPNNIQAGRLLAEQLAKKTTSATFYAISGDYVTQASLDRSTGLQQYLSEQNQSLSAQSVANWSAEEAYHQSFAVLSHDTTINAVWCANDAIALGAIRTLVAMKKRNKVIVGSINWPASVINNAIDVSIGGHVTLGALAIINSYDILHSSQPAKIKHHTLDIFSLHNPQSLKLVQQIHANQVNIDFRQFSHSAPQRLEFTINNLLAQVK